jgi:hypothetical protein
MHFATLRVASVEGVGHAINSQDIQMNGALIFPHSIAGSFFFIQQ